MTGSDTQPRADEDVERRLIVEIDGHLEEHSVPRRCANWGVFYGWEEKHVSFLRRLLDSRDAALREAQEQRDNAYKRGALFENWHQEALKERDAVREENEQLRAALQRAADKLCHYTTDYPQPDALSVINECDKLLARGHYYVRPTDEFYDGRFERVSPPPVDTDSGSAARAEGRIIVGEPEEPADNIDRTLFAIHHELTWQEARQALIDLRAERERAGMERAARWLGMSTNGEARRCAEVLRQYLQDLRALRLRDKWLVKAEELERSHDPH